MTSKKAPSLLVTLRDLQSSGDDAVSKGQDWDIGNEVSNQCTEYVCKEAGCFKTRTHGSHVDSLWFRVCLGQFQPGMQEWPLLTKAADYFQFGKMRRLCWTYL